VSGSYPHGRLLDEILFRLAPEAGAKSMRSESAISEAQAPRRWRLLPRLCTRAALPE